MEYRTATIDTGFLTRRAFSASGPAAAIGASVALYCRLVRDFGAAQVVFALEAQDEQKGVFRRNIAPDYKGKRKPPPAEYLATLAELREHLPLLGAWQAWSEAEADDVAYTISREWPGPHLLWSADKDWLQFLDDGVDLLRPDCSQRPRDVPPEEWRRPGDALITARTCQELTGLTPSGWYELLCLAGDPVDGIPGLPRVGKGRAETIHGAAPTLVRDLLAAAGDRGPVPDDEAMRQRALVAATAPEQAQWVEVAIREIDALRVSAALVQPYRVELQLEPPVEGGLEDLRSWLEGHDLGAMFEQVAQLIPDADDVAAPAAQVVDDDDIPF